MAAKRKVVPKRKRRRASPRETPHAHDALPVGAILLNEAYELVLDAVLEHPNALPEFDEDWSAALEASKKYEEETGHDQTVFDAELTALWHEKKRANLFFRLSLDERQLAARVLDPRTGLSLELIPPGWVSGKWDTYIPPGIWDEYVDNEDYESPGPDGSVLGGAVRQVFFDKDEFQKWLVNNFPKTSALSPTASEENMLRDVSRKRGTDAVNFALKELAGRGTDLIGLTKVQQLDLVNEVLKSKGKKITVALSTLYRTLASRENAIK